VNCVDSCLQISDLSGASADIADYSKALEQAEARSSNDQR
jgi:hypothetical protein